MSLSDFHLLKNILIEAMKIERDEIPPIEKSIDDCNQSLQGLQMQLNVAQSGLSMWESKEQWSTRKINARNRKLSALNDEKADLRTRLRARKSTVDFRSRIGRYFPILGWLGLIVSFIVFFYVEEFGGGEAWMRLSSLGMVMFFFFFFSYWFWVPNSSDPISDKLKEDIRKIKQQSRIIRKELKENSDEFISKKRSTAKASVTKVEEEIDYYQSDIVANQSNLDNLRHKKEGLIESVSHLVPYSENLS